MGCHIGTPSGYNRARKLGLFENICPRFVDGALEILDEVLEKAEHKQTELTKPESSTVQ
jgi:hypothetical protein